MPVVYMHSKTISYKDIFSIIIMNILILEKYLSCYYNIYMTSKIFTKIGTKIVIN